MREIIFKAKRKDNGEWVEGFYIHCTVFGKDFIFLKGNESQLISEEGCLKMFYFEVITETLCQYTGLTDYNGNRIWENDIVKEFNAEGKACSISKIVFSDYSLNLGWCSVGIKSLFKYDKRVFNVGFGENDSKKCVVIGNVFDNADLLEG